jgi:hypothetical protein
MSGPVIIEVRHVYGVQTAYPACQTAALLARLAGTKTLTAESLATIRALGYRLEIKQLDAADLLGGAQ